MKHRLESRQSTKHALYFSIDRNFFHEMLSVLNSIEENYPHHPDIIVDAMGLCDAEVGTLESRRGVTVISSKYHRRNSEYAPSKHPIVYNRFVLWTSEFECYDNMLHLDADIRVLGPLDDLVEREDFTMFDNRMTIFGSRLGVFDYRRITASNCHLLDLMSQDHMPLPTAMGNAGVFLIPKKYRASRHYDQLVYLMDRYKSHVSYADQSIINIWMLYNHIALSRETKFNFMYWFFRLPDVDLRKEEIRILHYVSDHKPGHERFAMWPRIGADRDWMLEQYYRYKEHVQ